MYQTEQTTGYGVSTRVPRPVSDGRLQSLDAIAAILVVMMALGPLTTYAIFGS
jgi:hypothetical protein